MMRMILVDVSSFVFVEWFQRIKWQRRGYIIHMKRSIDSPTTQLQVQSFFVFLFVLFVFVFVFIPHTQECSSSFALFLTGPGVVY